MASRLSDEMLEASKSQKEMVIVICTSLQIVTSAIPLLRLLKTRTPSGFSVDSQYLYAIGFWFKYLHVPNLHTAVPEGAITGYTALYCVRLALCIAMALTLCVSTCIPRYYQGESGRFWLVVGAIVSFVLAGEFTNYDRSRFTIIVYTFGSYLDCLSWIPQVNLSLQKTRIDRFVRIYFVGMLFHDFASVIDMTYDYHRDHLPDDMKFKFFAIKTIVIVAFFMRRLHARLIVGDTVANEILPDNSLNEVVFVSSAQEYSDKVLFRILGIGDGLTNTKLMSPY